MIQRRERAEVEQECSDQLHQRCQPVDPARLPRCRPPATAGGRALHPALGIDGFGVLQVGSRREEDRADEERDSDGGPRGGSPLGRDPADREARGAEHEQHRHPPAGPFWTPPHRWLDLVRLEGCSAIRRGLAMMARLPADLAAVSSSKYLGRDERPRSVGVDAFPTLGELNIAAHRQLGRWTSPLTMSHIPMPAASVVAAGRE